MFVFEWLNCICNFNLNGDILMGFCDFKWKCFFEFDFVIVLLFVDGVILNINFVILIVKCGMLGSI